MGNRIWWRTDEERQVVRRPFPREMGVPPHQLIGRVLEAYEAYGRLLRKEPQWSRYDRRAHARLYRQLFGESLKALGRRLDRQRNHWRATWHPYLCAYVLEGAAP